MILRSVSAVKIQSFWRKVQSKKIKDTINVINQARASKRLQRWYRNLKFVHRNRFIQQYNFYEKGISNTAFYIQLFIYMNLPFITNTLGFNIDHATKFLPYENIKQYKDLY